jgi:AcrR family transcriptional regulator
MREQILSGTIKYLFANGIKGLSLRPLANEIGTSDRMIIYYFETKDKLLVETVGMIAAQIINQFELSLQQSLIKTAEELIKSVWTIFTAVENRNAALLLFEIEVLSLREPDIYKEIARNLINDWVSLFERNFSEMGFSLEKCKAISVWVASELMGLFLLYLISGEESVSGAVDSLIERINKF